MTISDSEPIPPPVDPGRRGGSGVAARPPAAQSIARLLPRITRAQKLIAVLGVLELLVAGVLIVRGLPWPLSLLQKALTSWLGLSDAGASAYAIAAVLQWVLVMGGAVVLWLTFSWRLGRFPKPFLVAFCAIAGACLAAVTSSPTATLWGWIVIATLAITYIHFYRKGRFGYTRAATGAVFSHLALICFFIAFPFALVAVFGAPAQAADECDGTASMREECPELDEGQADAPPVADLPPYAALILDDGVIEVLTDTTSSVELRALFDQQYDSVDRSVSPSASVVWQMQIRCGLVPKLPDTHDAILATGVFATPPEETGGQEYTVEQLRGVGARWATSHADRLAEAGLASTTDVAFDISERRECAPPPLPPGAVSPDAVVAAAEQAGLDVTVTDPQESDPVCPDVNIAPSPCRFVCYELGCLQRMVTDQFTVIVWPTADAAQHWLDGATIDGVLFEPVTTAHLSAEDYSIYEDGSCDVTVLFEQCSRTYKDGLVSAAASLARSE